MGKPILTAACPAPVLPPPPDVERAVNATTAAQHSIERDRRRHRDRLPDRERYATGPCGTNRLDFGSHLASGLVRLEAGDDALEDREAGGDLAEERRVVRNEVEARVL